MYRPSCFLTLAIAVTGCSGSAPEADVAAILDGLTPSSGGATAIEDHDFGPVLARGQVLRHHFTFTNTTKRPIRLTGATAMTPCCSHIGPISEETIAPGGHCPIRG